MTASGNFEQFSKLRQALRSVRVCQFLRQLTGLQALKVSLAFLLILKTCTAKSFLCSSVSLCSFSRGSFFKRDGSWWIQIIYAGIFEQFCRSPNFPYGKMLSKKQSLKLFSADRAVRWIVKTCQGDYQSPTGWNSQTCQTARKEPACRKGRKQFDQPCHGIQELRTVFLSNYQKFKHLYWDDPWNSEVLRMWLEREYTRDMKNHGMDLSRSPFWISNY